MDIDTNLNNQRPLILEGLIAYLKDEERRLSRVNPWGADVCQRLMRFVEGGKLVRGALVLLLHGVFGGSSTEAARQTAAAMELIQAAFLIHDDIMDRDYVRRGHPTINAQYQSEGHNFKFGDPEHYGNSMGICAGDIAFFLAMRLLADLDASAEIRNKILLYSSRTIVSTAVAQMQDVSSGTSLLPGASAGVEADVLNLYRYKTGRYSFSLPFVCGAILAGQDARIQNHLETVGDELGILYQIRDDELGLFADEESIGKPSGSDIREGKQTLHMIYLMKALSDSETEWLSELTGASRLSAEDIQRLRTITNDRGIKKKIDAAVQKRSDAVRKNIRSIPRMGRQGIDLLTSLLEFVISRKA